MSPQIVISASRRTDIPAFYMPWFMACIERGHFDVINPYNHQTSRVTADPDQVHSIVFWSKNFGPFLDHAYGRLLERRGYHLFFNFTINSPHPLLEPAVPPIEQRLAQLARLSDQHGPDCIQWRFDPICHFKDSAGRQHDNLAQFQTIARQAANMGIAVCITSFVDLYRKVQRRVKHIAGMTLFDPPLETKIAHIMKMAATLSELKIALQLCCEKELLTALPNRTTVQPAACIPNSRLAALYGPGIALTKDSGQRKAAGCQCGISKDIGSYALHPCRHNCLFCYANPSSDQRPT
jgi:hypothetical protein